MFSEFLVNLERGAEDEWPQIELEDDQRLNVSGEVLHREDLQTLTGRQWLNDKVGFRHNLTVM